MKKFIYIIPLFFFLNSHAQINIDSLSEILKHSKQDTSTLKTLSEKIPQLNPIDIEAAELIGNWVSSKAKLVGDKKIEAIVYQNMAMNYIDANIYDKAVLFATKAQEIAEQNHYPEIEAKALNEIGNMYMENHQYSKAIECFNKSIDAGKRNNFKKGIAIAKYNLAGILLQRNYKNRDSVNLALSLMNESISLVKDIGDTVSIIKLSMGASQAYLDATNYDSSIFLLKEAEGIILKKGKEANLINLYMRYGDAYVQMGNDLLALNYLKKAEYLAKKYKTQRWLYNIYTLMAQAYENMKNYKAANEYNKLYSDIHDSLLSAENFEKASDLQNKFLREKKEKELIRLNSDNRQKSMLSRILIGTVACLLVFFSLLYRNITIKRKFDKQEKFIQKQRIAELEKEKQIQVFDAILKGQEEERSRIAKDLHDGLGGLLSGTKLALTNMKDTMIMQPEQVTAFEKSITQLDSSIVELRKIAQNLMPEALVRFGLKNALLDYCNSMQMASNISINYEQLGVERELGNTAQLYIYRIIQELINNAIKYSTAKNIFVQITKTEQKVLLTVEDNGTGFDKSILKTSPGIGYKSIQQRVDYFKGDMKIEGAPGEGTQINIELYV